MRAARYKVQEEAEPEMTEYSSPIRPSATYSSVTGKLENEMALQICSYNSTSKGYAGVAELLHK